MVVAAAGCVHSCCPQHGFQWMAVCPSADLWTLTVLRIG